MTENKGRVTTSLLDTQPCECGATEWEVSAEGVVHSPLEPVFIRLRRPTLTCKTCSRVTHFEYMEMER